jgi:hypothetical protein
MLSRDADVVFWPIDLSIVDELDCGYHSQLRLIMEESASRLPFLSDRNIGCNRHLTPT